MSLTGILTIKDVDQGTRPTWQNHSHHPLTAGTDRTGNRAKVFTTQRMPLPWAHYILTEWPLCCQGCLEAVDGLRKECATLQQKNWWTGACLWATSPLSTGVKSRKQDVPRFVKQPSFLARKHNIINAIWLCYLKINARLTGPRGRSWSYSGGHCSLQPWDAVEPFMLQSLIPYHII